MRRVGAASAVLAFAAFTGGCAAAPASGPMNLGGPEEWESCMSSAGEKVTFGDVFSIPGTDPVKLTGLRLVEAHGLNLEASYILPPDDGYVGAAGYPPKIKTWDQRKDVLGALVEPGGEQSFALVVAPTGDGTHTADGFVVTYEIDGKTYENQNFVAFEVQENCNE